MRLILQHYGRITMIRSQHRSGHNADCVYCRTIVKQI